MRKAIIGLLQTFFDMLKEAHEGRYTNEAYQLLLPSASVIQPLTRSYLANKGKELGLQVKVVDVIVVELTHVNEKYMLPRSCYKGALQAQWPGHRGPLHGHHQSQG